MEEIKIQNVSKKIKRNMVLRNISIEINKGEIIGLSGENGSGKTMLMRLIIGLVFPSEGEIIIQGKVLGKDIEFPENVGFLIENPAFLDYCSGFENLKILADIRRVVSDEEIYQTLKRVGLESDNRKKYKKYSLGMKQRLGIACAILEKPDILVLDEPTNALDENGIELLKQIIREEKQRGTTILLSCHDKLFLEEMADRIYEMHNGRIVYNYGGTTQ